MPTNFRLIHNQVYVTKFHLINFGMNKGTLNNLISDKKNNIFISFKDSNKITWILFESIPYKYKRKLRLPLNEYEAIEFIAIESKKEKKTINMRKNTVL